MSYTLEYRKELTAKGLCYWCRNPVAPGSKKCPQCIEKSKQNHKKLLDYRKQNHLCIGCGQPNTGTTVYCDACKQKAKNTASIRYYRYRDAGVCVYCGKPRVEQQLVCATHLSQRRSGLAAQRQAPDYNKRQSAKTRKALYGITQEQFDLLVLQQNNKCCICGKDMSGPKDRHIDHDHFTGKIRGLLCNNCNTGIGKFQDSPELLEKAAEYLRRYR